MALRFEHAFTVKASPAKVWAYLTDPYRVAPALPGAAITEKTGEGTWNGTITVKVGPVAARYKGTVHFEALDAAARTATIVAKGQDLSGRGGADLKMESRLSEKTPGETEVAMISEVNVTGIMAQFGRGLVQDVSNQMFQKFTEAARAELEKPTPVAPVPGPPESAAVVATAARESPIAAAGATPLVTAPTSSASPHVAAPAAPAPSPPPAAAPPIEVVSFGSKLLARAVGRMMRKPSFWIVVAAIAAVVYWLSSR
jgi:carbon monoxide dehydrogenase subunit G